MGISEILAWIVSGGAIGGIIDLAFKLDFEAITEKQSNQSVKNRCISYNGVCLGFWAFVGLVAINGLIGAGGAVGLQFILIGVQKFSTETTIENQILLFSIAIVAGFSARRLLPQITNRLARDLDLTKKTFEEKSYELEKKAEEVERGAEKGAQKTVNLVRALQSLLKGAPASELRWGIEHLTAGVQDDPKVREYAIVLGRLYRKDNNLPSAIDVLTKFLESKGLEQDQDYADALYNRACYKTLLFGNTKEPQSRIEALKDLEKSINLSPDNKGDARLDEDFKALWKDAEFKRLVE